MTTFREAWARLAAFFRKRGLDREFDEELRAHIELATQDYIRQGMSAAEARRMALIKLGGVEQSKELHRESRGVPWLDGVAQDVRFAFRSLGRTPGFTLTAVVILALGIGINAAVFTITKTMLFGGNPLFDPDNRILYLFGSGSTAQPSYSDFEDWKAQAKSFTGIGLVASGGLRLILTDDNGERGTYDGTELSANSFQVLGYAPILGRDFMSSDGVPGASPVAILSFGLWKSRYEKNPSIIGRTIRIDDIPTTVIGVMPEGFKFPHYRVDLWTPITTTTDILRRENRTMFFAFGRMADGVTLRSARAEMDTIGRRLEAAYPLTNRNFLPRVMRFRDGLGQNGATFYGSLCGAVGFVLLVSCANLANFLLARAIGRSREISVRIALGASRRRVIRQLLIESVVLSSLGGALGWLVSLGSVRAYELFAWFPGSYTRYHYSLDYKVLLYLAATSLLTGLLFGLAPALTLSKIDINSALKDGSWNATGTAARKRLSTFLVAGEVAVTLVLLAGAGLMIRSFFESYTANIGVRTDNILAVSVWLQPPRYPDVQAQTAFLDRVSTHLKAIPGVDSLALASSLPGLFAGRVRYDVAGAEPVDGRSRPSVSAVTIGRGYFQTLGAEILSGREFSNFDGPSGVPVVIVNQQFAEKIWPGESPIGKRLRVFDGQTPHAWRTVVGVASNIVQLGYPPTLDFNPVIYLPFRQNPWAFMDFLARTRVPPETLENAFRREIQTMDPNLVLYSGLGTVGDGPTPLSKSLVFSDSWSHGVDAALFFILAAIALLLASAGLYAVVAHSLSQRTREIGIRIAMGASRRDILRLVFPQGMVPLGAGLAIGLVLSFAVTRVLKSQLVHVSTADPMSYCVAIVVLVASAALGCWIPARRAMRLDPVVALRNE